MNYSIDDPCPLCGGVLSIPADDITYIRLYCASSTGTGWHHEFGSHFEINDEWAIRIKLEDGTILWYEREDGMMDVLLEPYDDGSSSYAARVRCWRSFPALPIESIDKMKAKLSVLLAYQ